MHYKNKLSGPLMDRIDLQVHVSGIDCNDLLNPPTIPEGETSERIQTRVAVARQHQIHRQGKINTHLDSNQVQEVCPLTNEQKQFMQQAMERFSLSTRGFYRTLKVARSIADLEGSEIPSTANYHEALSYRNINGDQI